MKSIIGFQSLLRCLILLSLVDGGQISAADSVRILPAKFTLTGNEARQRLLVQGVEGGILTGQITEGVVFESSDPKVIRIEKGIAVPVSNGKAVITARVGEQTATTTVNVTKQDVPHRWSFRNHVQPVLSKAGCNSGACHGALAGKNGLKLSLRGYDPEADFHTISRQSRGRRIVPSDPGRSLILTKPTNAIPHKGGLRFEVDSLDYRVVAEWIAQGQTPPKDKDPRMVRLEILPKNVLLKPGATQQIVVMAHFSDDHSEDVTRWAKYTATNLSVAKVDDAGTLSVIGHGEGAVVAWYLSKNVIGSVTVPFAGGNTPEVYAKAKRANFIDELVLEKLKQLNIPPSPLTNDGEFIRRVFLDTIGVLPTADETRKFLADKSADKRDKLIDALLKRPEFVDYWSYKWSDLLLVTGAKLRPKAVEAYYKWIRDRVKENAPWDRFARDVATARGSTFENGAANFYSLHQDPLDMAETVSMAFLGMSINCARCHDHPLEKWTNDDYYGMAGMFTRVRGKGWGGDSRNGDGNRVIFTATEGELIQPRTGKPQQPRPLDGKAVPFDSTADRREHLAKWLTSPQNPYFSRAIVNRVWANFLGVGIVEKVDDLRLTNPPSNVALLSALADYLAKNKYDLKKLMRLILQSQTYQRSSLPIAGNETDNRFYSRYYPRRLQAEVLLDAISQATGSPTKFPGKPAGTRALQLPDSSIASYFLETFGRPERIITCDCERSDEPSMVQVLHIMNGNTLNDKLAAKGNRLEKLLAAKTANGKLMEEAFLTVLSRFPTEEEKSQMLEVLQAADEHKKRVAAQLTEVYTKASERDPLPDERALIDSLAGKEKRRTVEDIFWSILSSREFLFNH